MRGDEALATFVSPRQALRAATELQATFVDEAARNADLPLHVGIGIDLGEAIPVEGGYRGAALNVAARLCANAAAGEILASESVTGLARGLEGIRFEPRDAFMLKGIDDPVRAVAVTGTAEPGSTAAVRARPTELPIALDPVVAMIGRDIEARRLRWAWRQARRGTGRGLVVSGPLGAGKTRLAAEPASIAGGDGARVVYASALGPADGVPSAIARALEDGVPALLVVDDVESASAADLAALGSLVEHTAGRALLLVALVNGEPSDEVTRLLRRISGAEDWLRLGPLDESSVAAIIATYAADAAEPPPVWAIAQASDGLPSQVHALASGWAQGEVSRRLGSSVSRAAEGRRDLRRLEAEVATDVVDLQLARERLRSDRTRRRRGCRGLPVQGPGRLRHRRTPTSSSGGNAWSPRWSGAWPDRRSSASSARRAAASRRPSGRVSLPALAAGALPGAETLDAGSSCGPARSRCGELDACSSRRCPERAARGGCRPRHRDPLAAAAASLQPKRGCSSSSTSSRSCSRPRATTRSGSASSTLRDRGAAGRPRSSWPLRADFYGRCAAYPALAELLGANHVLVGPMTAEEYRRAIEGPARRAGLRIDPALVGCAGGRGRRRAGRPAAALDGAASSCGSAARAGSSASRRTPRRGGVRGAVARLAEAAYGEPRPGAAGHRARALPASGVRRGRCGRPPARAARRARRDREPDRRQRRATR